MDMSCFPGYGGTKSYKKPSTTVLIITNRRTRTRSTRTNTPTPVTRYGDSRKSVKPLPSTPVYQKTTVPTPTSKVRTTLIFSNQDKHTSSFTSYTKPLIPDPAPTRPVTEPHHTSKVTTPNRTPTRTFTTPHHTPTSKVTKPNRTPTRTLTVPHPTPTSKVIHRNTKTTKTTPITSGKCCTYLYGCPGYCYNINWDISRTYVYKETKASESSIGKSCKGRKGDQLEATIFDTSIVDTMLVF